MDKRTFVALLLTALVIVLTPMIFPSVRRTPTRPSKADSLVAPEPPRLSSAESSRTALQPGSIPAAVPTPVSAAPQSAGETTAVRAPKASYVFTSAGAAPLAIELMDYRSHHAPVGGPVQLRQAGSDALLHYRLVIGADTISLDTLHFSPQRAVAPNGAPTVAYRAAVGARTLTVAYLLPADSTQRYVVHAQGSVDGAPLSSGAMLIDLPRGLRSAETDTLDDIQHEAFGFRPVHDGVQSVNFSKLDPATSRVDTGPIRWVAVRNKYFLVGLLAPPSETFSALTMTGAPRVNKVAPTAYATAVLPLQSNSFAFDMYAGPQEFERLRAVGNDLDQVNPYAGWLHVVVQPFATIVMRILLWMKRTLPISYGWVLVLFGVLVRLVLWPLNQNAMRNGIKMQRLQPELTEVQKRYKSEPEKQRDAIMKVYQDHGMSPLSPVMGCLPMILPMPVLFALYFVFQNTIEFRGVHFLWLPDLSLHDPFYIIPIVMGASMFVLSWIGMRGVPPTPQSKMMAYMMPGMMTVMFLNFPSGLNLYYAVQNIASLPQQWMLSRERAKAGVAAPAPRTSSPSGGKNGGSGRRIPA